MSNKWSCQINNNKDKSGKILIIINWPMKILTKHKNNSLLLISLLQKIIKFQKIIKC